MAESFYLLAAASHELGVVDLILSYLESPEAQAVGIMAGLEASAAKPLYRNVAEHYAKLGHLASLKFVVGPVMSSEDANRLMYYAARGGHEAIVRQCHEEWGASADQAMAIAASHGHEGIARLCHEWGASADQAIAIAANYGHENIVRLCLKWGATNFDDAITRASITGHEAIVRLCREWKDRIQHSTPPAT